MCVFYFTDESDDLEDEEKEGDSRKRTMDAERVLQTTKKQKM